MNKPSSQPNLFSLQSSSSKSDNETFIKLLKEIRDRDSLIQEIKSKIQEKDILIEHLTKLANSQQLKTNLPTPTPFDFPKNNCIYYNLTNQITSFFLTINSIPPKEPINNQNIQSKYFLFNDLDVKLEIELFFFAKNELTEELEKKTKLNEILNQEKLQLSSKLNSNKIKIKQIMKIVNEKINLYTKKNTLLSESISKITNNITKAEKEKYDLEEIIFQQEDKINNLLQQVSKANEVNEQKNEIIQKNKVIMKDLNEKINDLTQQNTLLRKRNASNSNYSVKLPNIQKIYGHNKRKGNVLYNSIQSSNSTKNLFETNHLLKKLKNNDEEKTPELKLEEKKSERKEQTQLRKLNEVKSLMNSLILEFN